MTLTGENGDAQRETCFTATLSHTDRTETNPGSPS
jgi:hypothetical protein